MKGIQFDNAAQRKTYVGQVYEAGTRAIKERILRELPEEFSELHRRGIVHIHDLEAYGQTYNCVQMDILKGFPFARFAGYSVRRRIAAIFDHYRDLVVKLGNEQSGGMGFPNFDVELETLFERLHIEPTSENLETLRECIEAFMDWANAARDRCGQTTYYVSLNLGLATGTVGRFATRTVLEYFGSSSAGVIKPNVVFKVKNGVNALPGDPNRDLLDLAVESTSRKMIPTYLLLDSAPNQGHDPRKLAIMGCRTRVVADVWGEDRSIGRGNIDYVSINLPRIALEVAKAHPADTIDVKLQRFEEEWDRVAAVVRGILLDRYRRLLTLEPDDFPCNQAYRLWLEDFGAAGGLEAVFKHGTFSIGFIGLSETVEILTGEKYWSTAANYEIALGLVRHMRDVVDEYRREAKLNFTLLASSGEFISGRFPTIDRELFDHAVLKKGFYTNSFHVEVDAGLSPFDKIRLEGPFHALANGGCITYVEFSSPPLGNVEAIHEIIQTGVAAGVAYLGINFPLDSCRDCDELGTFDRCPRCGGDRILRVRRVSGYLEDLDFFTAGKRAEVAHRRPNLLVSACGGR